MPTVRLRRRVREPMTWLAILVALVVHGAIFATVNVLGLSILGPGPGPSARKPPPPEEDVELAATCFDNVVYATSGRSLLCLAPWIGNVDECLADAQMSLWMDLSSCQARNDPGTAITMISPRAAEKLTPIDPERLLDETKPPPT